MRTCTKRIEFDAGHRLTQHESKCANVHGHRWFLDITCGAESLDSIGRVIDFGEIKRWVGSWIDEHLDHTYIAYEKDPLIDSINRFNRKPVHIVPFEPTSENMAKYLFEISRGLLDQREDKVVQVRLYETPSSYAEFRA